MSGVPTFDPREFVTEVKGWSSHTRLSTYFAEWAMHFEGELPTKTITLKMSCANADFEQNVAKVWDNTSDTSLPSVGLYALCRMYNQTRCGVQVLLFCQRMIRVKNVAEQEYALWKQFKNNMIELVFRTLNAERRSSTKCTELLHAMKDFFYHYQKNVRYYNGGMVHKVFIMILKSVSHVNSITVCRIR